MSSHDTAAPAPSRARRLVRAAAYALVVAVVLFGVGFLVRSTWGPLQELDDAIIGAATSFTRPREGLRSFLLSWQWVTQPIRLYLVGTLLCLWVWLAKGLRTRAWWAFGTMMVAWFVGFAAKDVFQRARPAVEDPVSKAPGYSFPSGHALNSAAWATIVVVLLWPLLRTGAARVVAVVLAVLVVLVTALDRVLLGVHYPSDVTVGVLTGVGLALSAYAGYSGWAPPDPTQVDDPDVGAAHGADAGHATPAAGGGRPRPPTQHPEESPMSFLTRWDEDQSRPTLPSALRDLAVRAVLPAVVLFALIVGFGFVLEGPLLAFATSENGVSRWLEDARTPTGETVTKFMSMMGNTEYVIAVAVLVCALVWWRTKQWWYAVVPLVAISLQATVFVVAAAVVGRSRPPVERLDPSPPTSSYPSGHVGASTALYVTLALMVTRIGNVVVRRVVFVACVIVPLLVSYARLYRGAHHPSDVAVGVVNGLVCALLAWNYLRREPAGDAGRDDRGGAARTDRAQTRA